MHVRCDRCSKACISAYHPGSNIKIFNTWRRDWFNCSESMPEEIHHCSKRSVDQTCHCEGIIISLEHLNSHWRQIPCLARNCHNMQLCSISAPPLCPPAAQRHDNNAEFEHSTGTDVQQTCTYSDGIAVCRRPSLTCRGPSRGAWLTGLLRVAGPEVCAPCSAGSCKTCSG